MSTSFLANEPLVRLIAFAAVLLTIIVCERLAPRRPQHLRGARWRGNFGCAVLDTLIVRLFFPAAAVGAALVAGSRGWGLFNVVAAPTWIAVAASAVVLDLAVYLQHVLFHAVPPLWRVHRMHHSDPDIDVTTGIRFHPVEAVLSMLLKAGVVVALGAPVVAVLIFEVLLNAASMFTHANVRVPPRLDAVLRWWLVTPDMHRVHHSVDAHETNSNFGFALSWWDRMLGTYRAQPAAGHDGMTIGIESFRDPRELRLDRMLLQPFRNDERADVSGERAITSRPRVAVHSKAP